MNIRNQNKGIRFSMSICLLFLLLSPFCANLSAEETTVPPSEASAVQEPESKEECPQEKNAQDCLVEGVEWAVWEAANDLYLTAQELRKKCNLTDAYEKIEKAINLTKGAIPDSPMRGPYIKEKNLIEKKLEEEKAKQTKGTDWGKVGALATIIFGIISIVGIYIAWLSYKDNKDKQKFPQETLPNPVNESNEPSEKLTDPPKTQPIVGVFDSTQPEQTKNEDTPIEAKRTAGETITLPIRGVNYTFCWCPAGNFWMGSQTDEDWHQDDETRHNVTLSHSFWMLETPVTQRLWEDIMEDNPSYFKGANRPVECVSWDDCQEFIDKLNREELLRGYKAILPSEAQWEYACRAGTDTPFSFGSVLNGDKANCDGNYPYGTEKKGKYIEETTKVKRYPPNNWNLYDMHGNVWEWCSDWYDGEYYKYSPEIDPTGPDSGSNRVYRGGSWDLNAGRCRSAIRDWNDPSYRILNLGFRLALVPSK